MDELNCKTVRESLWGYAAQSRKAGYRQEQMAHAVEADRIDLHLDACRDCESHYAEVSSLQTGLRNLPVRRVPPLLNTRLKVLASREVARQSARRDFHTWFVDRASRARLAFDTLLKPFAVPAAGGILASFLCFGVIVDTLHYSPDWGADIPIGFTADVSFQDATPFTCNGQDVLVQLSVDATGHVTDYSLPSNLRASREEQLEIGNLVLYSTFTPAMRMGRPVSSKQLFLMKHFTIKG